MEPVNVNTILADNFGITSTGKIHALGCVKLCSYAVPTERDLRLGAKPAKCCVQAGTIAAAKWDRMSA